MQKAWNQVRNVDSQGKDLGTNWNFVLALHLHKICQKQRVQRLQMFICEVLNHDIKGLVMKTSFYVISHFFVIFCLRSEIKRPMRFLNSWMEYHQLEKLGSGRVSACAFVYVCHLIYILYIWPYTSLEGDGGRSVQGHNGYKESSRTTQAKWNTVSNLMCLNRFKENCHKSS